MTEGVVGSTARGCPARDERRRRKKNDGDARLEPEARAEHVAHLLALVADLKAMMMGAGGGGRAELHTSSPRVRMREGIIREREGITSRGSCSNSIRVIRSLAFCHHSL